MRRKGFTLIELIVVMAILAILILLAAPKYKEYTNEAHLTQVKVNVKELEQASNKYYMTYNDWPRLSDTPYTAEQVEEFGEKILAKTGKVVVLEENGNYYDIDYAKIKNYVNISDDGVNYILQNPVGSVFYIDKITEEAKERVQKSMGLTVKELPIGSIVYDETWLWEHRDGYLYAGTAVAKPVEWLVVSKNCVEYPNNSVTLMTKNKIGRYLLDNSTNRGSSDGNNHWGNTGTGNATKGIRKFLNGSSYMGSDINSYPITFYDSFSESFKSNVLLTTVKNVTHTGVQYTTEDKVFIPSQEEVQSVWDYSKEYGIPLVETTTWTRTPETNKLYFSRAINPNRTILYNSGWSNFTGRAVYPVVNVSANMRVEQVSEGIYKIVK